MDGRARLRRGVFLTLLVVSTAASAANPDVWDAALEPRVARDVAALREAQQLFVHAQQAGAGDGSRLEMLRMARRALEQIGAGSSPDMRVRFFYGSLLGSLGEHERSVEILSQALAMAPHHPQASDAFFHLAIAYAHADRVPEELHAYEAFIAREPSRSSRSIGLSNFAEALMLGGDLEAAIRRYREATALMADNALAHWGLAVALDRSGDFTAAVASASVALSYDPGASQLNGPNVFFKPDYDRFWYRALGALARAGSASTPELERLWWERAAMLWGQYIDAADINDRWLPLARSRLALCEKQIRRVRSRIGGKRSP